MKKYLIYLSVAILVFGFSGTAGAYSGTFMFNASGNDSNTPISELEMMIENWFTNEGMARDIDLEFYAKVDAPATTTTDGSGDIQISYNGDPDESESGSWLTADPIDFYSVKAGNGYAFYWVDGALSGDWSTEHRDYKGLSHLSAWVDTSNDPGPAVPEPSTIILLVSGLLGIAGFSRKFKS
ncbi:MAG: PEP-CTERM sorting domain-containing protein [Desulfobacterales bacterium]|nr:PEP-CTERM sorting domain-containing protein [Desulfobacterales bacterium]